MDTTTRNLQKIADKNKLFFVHMTAQLVDVKATLEVLLNLEEAKLVKNGASPDEAHHLIANKIDEHRKRLSTETGAFLKQLESQLESDAAERS